MRTPPARLGVLALLTAAACSRPPARQAADDVPTPSARSGGALHDEIRQAEEAWGRAIVTADMAALDRLVAPEFVLAAADTTVPPFPRAPWMENLRSRVVRTDSVSFSDLRVRGTSDSAVATLRFYWRPVYRDTARGEDRPSLQDTWVRRDGRWQVVRRVMLDPPR
jgi:hypothetical protein